MLYKHCKAYHWYEESQQLVNINYNIKYLVSPQDLCGIGEVNKLQDIGIESFKVEGRLKSPEYVATVAKSYRHTIDQRDVSKEMVSDMASTYSRGFYSGWLNGVAHQEFQKPDQISRQISKIND